MFLWQKYKSIFIKKFIFKLLVILNKNPNRHKVQKYFGYICKL